jgi:cytosine deaminase
VLAHAHLAVGYLPGESDVSDLVVRNARLAETLGALDISITDGVVSAVGGVVEPGIEEIDASGCLLIAGFVDSHLHLDKTRLTDRLEGPVGTLAEAMAATKLVKADFTVEDVYQRGGETIRRCIAQGTTRIRTQVEVDPLVGLRGLDGVLALAEEYAWAVDMQICVFPQDGLESAEDVELLAEGLKRGATVIGGAPYADKDPAGQIDKIFELAEAFDVDVDLHLDLAEGTEAMQVEYVCRKTDEFGYGGRVTVGHVTQLAYVEPDRYFEICEQLSQSGVGVTVLPSTDLFLMGRASEHARTRGVLPLDGLLERKVACSVATNNVLNAFTPYGDCSLLRMANLYANVCHVSTTEGLVECLGLVTDNAARVLGIADYGISPGNPADLVLLDSASPASAVAEIALPLWGMKAGRRTFSRARPELHDQRSKECDCG